MKIEKIETKGEDYPLSSWLGLKKKEKIEVKNKKQKIIQIEN